MPPALRAAALRGAAWVARDQGDHAATEAFAQVGLDLFQELDDPRGQMESLLLLALAAEDRGDLARAHVLHEGVIDRLNALQDTFWTTAAMYNRGRLARLRGDLAGAKRHLDQALALCRATYNHHVVVGVLAELGEIAFVRGELAEAVALYQERLDDHHDARSAPRALEGLAGVAMARGEDALAARLFGAAETASERLGIILTPIRQQELAARTATARNALDETAFAAAWDEGRRLPLDEARAEAAKVADLVALSAGTTSAGAADSPTVFGLTRREREVLALLAEGRADREIAEALFISRKTVGTHVTNLLGKLGLPSRAAAVAYVHRHGLV
jgi:ATP/maltotriose-dependent transcriptional regulator MalT